MYSLEEVISKFKTSKNKVEEIVNFFMERINYEKLRFVSKLIGNDDGKYKLNINQIKDCINFMLFEAIENYLNNPSDSVYVSENIILNVSNYGGKRYISISPRYDFTK